MSIRNTYNLSSVSVSAAPRSTRRSGVVAGGGYFATDSTISGATARAEYAEEAGRAQEAVHALEADHAVEADVAAKAMTLDENSPLLTQYLSRVADDVAKGKITFEQGLTAVGLAVFQDGAHFGEFIRSLYAGKGAGIDKDGNAEFETVRVRSYFEAVEYIVNRLEAIEGDQVLTEADTIERVVDNGDGTYGLYLRSKWDGYFTAQVEDNVLKGIINTLSTGSGIYYTCWLRVNSVNTTQNYLNVTLYPDDEVPAGKNYPPCELMKIARWGNQTDKTRQSCLYLSSTEGRIVKLTGVTKPILENWNYGATFGVVPEFLKLLNLPLAEGQDYIYARGIIAQDILWVDYEGKPIATYVDRGLWDATADYYSGAVNPTTGVFETSDVWYKGCKYRCMKTGTHDAPGWATTAWVMIEGNPNFTVDFAEHELYWRGDTFNATLTLIATLYNEDITALVKGSDVAWTRESYDGAGNRRVASDNAWRATTDSDNKRLLLTTADLDWDGVEGSISRIVFCCTATINDSNVATAEMNYEF